MAGIAVACAALGWGAAQLVRSPAQVAADAAPPPASVITAPVELRQLNETVVTRGAVGPSGTVQAGLRAPTNGEAVVTAVHVRVGDEVVAGQVLLEIAGRPVFAIEGTVPVYRDLVPGSEGEDVAQLQRALTAMGFPVSDDGVYGVSTKNAVRAWYERAGYDPAEATLDVEERIASAQDQVRGAERAVEDARDTLASAPEPDRAAAERMVVRADEDLANVRVTLAKIEAAAGAAVPSAELVTVSAFPATVREVELAPGDPVGDGALSLSTGDLTVSASLGASQAGLVREGQTVELTAEALSQTATGRVHDITAESAGTDATMPGGAPGSTLLVVPDSPLPREWNGQDVRVTIVAASSAGEVLVVPLAAVSADSGGRTRVVVVGEGESRRDVEVTTGLSGEGFVEVSPVGAAPLEPGDRVVVGTAGSP